MHNPLQTVCHKLLYNLKCKLSHLLPFKNKVKPLGHCRHPEDGDAGSSVKVENGWENEQKCRFGVSNVGSEQPERLKILCVRLKMLGHPNALSIDRLHCTEAYQLVFNHRTAGLRDLAR